MKKHIKDIILQIIPIAIGVYLGFFVSNWGEANKRQNQAEKLLESIRSEIKNNKNVLKNIVDYHIMLRDSSWYYIQKPNIDSRPQFFQGTRTQQLTGSAFQTGIQTGIINELPQEKIQLLNNLYNFQDFYNEYGKTVTNGMIMMDFSNNDEQNIRRVAYYLHVSMTDVVLQENDLIKNYTEVLKLLE